MSCAKSISNVNNIFVFQVLVTLRYLGKGSFFSECGDLHGISKSSVCRAVEWRMSQRPYANGLTISGGFKGGGALGASRDKKNKFSKSRVVRKKISERKKNHKPPAS